MTQSLPGCELKISEKAANVFKEMIKDEKKEIKNSYLRVGANSGGCSGWKYSLDFEDSIKPKDLVVCILDRPRHKNLISSVRKTGASAPDRAWISHSQ